MKKTLIALMALAGVAMAETQTELNAALSTALKDYYAGSSFSLTFELTKLGNSKHLLTLADSYYFISESSQYLGLAPSTSGMKDANNVDHGNIDGSSGNVSGTGAVDRVLTLDKEGIAYGWISFTVAEDGKYTRPGSTLLGSVITFAYNAELSSATFTLDRTSLGDDGSTNLGTVVVNMSNVTFDPTKISFAAGVEATNFVFVPEPATATLSLLALAGLAARRRRR